MIVRSPPRCSRNSSSPRRTQPIRIRILEVSRQFRGPAGRSPRQPASPGSAASPARQGSRSGRHNCCPARCRSRPPLRVAAGGRSSARACGPPSARSRAAGRTRARTGRRQSRRARGGVWPNAGPAAPWHRASRAASSAASRSRRSKNAGSLTSATLIASEMPDRQSRSERVPRNAKSLITANGGEKLPR